MQSCAVCGLGLQTSLRGPKQQSSKNPLADKLVYRGQTSTKKNIHICKAIKYMAYNRQGIDGYDLYLWLHFAAYTGIDMRSDGRLQGVQQFTLFLLPTNIMNTYIHV